MPQLSMSAGDLGSPEFSRSYNCCLFWRRGGGRGSIVSPCLLPAFALGEILEFVCLADTSSTILITIGVEHRLTQP